MAVHQHSHIASDRGPTCPGCEAAVTLELRTSDTHVWCFCLRCGRTFDARPEPISDYLSRVAAGLAPERRRRQLPFFGPDRRKTPEPLAA